MDLGKRCGVHWGVCPGCLGEDLKSGDGLSWCDRCRKQWSTNEREPCPDETVAVVTDGRSGETRLCGSHAECVKLHMTDCGIRYDDGTEHRARPLVTSMQERVNRDRLDAFRACAPVHVVPYDAAWPSRFEQERALLQPALAPWLVGPIEHVGSTAVPGLIAKPVIDIMAGVDSLAGSREALPVVAELGYVYFPYRAEVAHWFCKPSDSFRTHHLHLVPFASPLWSERLAFRDYLRAHPVTAAEYGELKQRLSERYRFDREAYTNAKSPFVQRVLKDRAPAPS